MSLRIFDPAIFAPAIFETGGAQQPAGPPRLIFTVPAEAAMFIVNPEQRLFAVAREQTIFTVTREAA